MKAVIFRSYEPLQTPGGFVAFEGKEKVFECKTLELPDKGNQKNISCILEGTYWVQKITRPSGKPGLHIENVPGRSAILIHSGTFATGEQIDILGCVMVGFRFVDVDKNGTLDIVESVKAFNALYAAMPNRFQLTIL